jgi:hypothetical protein
MDENIQAPDKKTESVTEKQNFEWFDSRMHHSSSMQASHHI